jgi:putative 3-oxoacyl-[acyl-carrier-protein] reductase
MNTTNNKIIDEKGKKKVLVTGSSRGIGKEIALYLAKNGFDIDVHYAHNKVKAEETADEIKALGCNAEILKFDIKNREECTSVLSDKLYYGIVLNAGIAKDNVFPVLEGDEWDDVIDTNLTGFYNVLKPLVMPMISNRIKGRIITLSSVSGLCGNRGQVNYSASKAGIIGATKALSLELAKRGITVNCIAPGVIETDMIKDVPVDEIKKIIPMKRLGQAREVASLANYLMSEDASYITGQVISVNGGMYL